VDAPVLCASGSSPPLVAPVRDACAVWSLEAPAQPSVAGLNHGASEFSIPAVALVLDAYDDAFSFHWRPSSSDRRY